MRYIMLFAPLFIFVSASAASAATISGDTYAASVATDNGTTELVPSAQGVALSGVPDNSFLDILGFSTTATMEVGFLDENTVAFAAFGSVGDLSNLVYSVTGLDFDDGGSPVAITGVALVNEQALRDDFETENFTSPTIAFTANSFTVTFAFMSDGTFADGLRFEFDIATAGDEVAPIPLPATAWMLGVGVAALGLARLRRASRHRLVA